MATTSMAARVPHERPQLSPGFSAKYDCQRRSLTQTTTSRQYQRDMTGGNPHPLGTWVLVALTLDTLNYLCLNHGNQRVFSILSRHNRLSQLFLIHLYTYVMGRRPLEIFVFFPHRDRIYTSESDVYRRQILTYKDGPRTERVNPCPTRPVYVRNLLQSVEALYVVKWISNHEKLH